MARKGLSRKGFTLVELLVVIAILTILFCMLLPMLKKAQELARRSVCASNLKALAQVMQIYAANNAGRALLCYKTNPPVRQYDYMVNFWGTDPNKPNMHYGCLVNDKMIGNPRQFYCPSETQSMFQFDTDDDPWMRHGPNGDYTRFAYGTRPLCGWGQSAATPSGFWVNYGWPHRDELDLPRYQFLEPAITIAADVLSDPYFVTRRHVVGVNFATAGGSVHWFETSNFNHEWQVSNGDYVRDDPITGLPPPTDLQGFYNESTSQGVWFDMDRAAR